MLVPNVPNGNTDVVTLVRMFFILFSFLICCYIQYTVSKSCIFLTHRFIETIFLQGSARLTINFKRKWVLFVPFAD